jgi:hypothetical protein
MPTPARDFNCPQRGTTELHDPGHVHRCESKKSVSYQEQRRFVCNRCPVNKNGACQALIEKEPTRPGLIEACIATPGQKCPLDKWQRVRWACDKCRSASVDVNGLKRCPRCTSHLYSIEKEGLTGDTYLFTSHSSRGAAYHRYPDGGHPVPSPPGIKSGTGYSWDANRPNHCWYGEISEGRLASAARQS